MSRSFDVIVFALLSACTHGARVPEDAQVTLEVSPRTATFVQLTSQDSSKEGKDTADVASTYTSLAASIPQAHEVPDPLLGLNPYLPRTVGPDPAKAFEAQMRAGNEASPSALLDLANASGKLVGGSSHYDPAANFEDYFPLAKPFRGPLYKYTGCSGIKNGIGSYGQVSTCRMECIKKKNCVRQVKEDVAVKKSNHPVLGNQSEMQVFAIEVEHQKKCAGDHVLPLYESFRDKQGYVYLTMPLMKHDLLGEPLGQFDEPTCAKWIKEIALGIKVIHKRGIAHRDIKCENILVGADGGLQIADFGLSINMGIDGSTPLTDGVGTTNHLAPECHLRKGCRGGPQDVFALGVTMFAILEGYWVFGPQDPSGGEVRRILKKEPIQFSSDRLSKDAIDLMTKMLDPEPTERITVDNILEHPFIQR